jgi:putative nucleotidyltransferase with HDIG domain
MNGTRGPMDKHDSLRKVLPQGKVPDNDKDRDEVTPSGSRRASLSNIVIGFLTALLLAFVLVPRFPLLKKGEVATRTIVAPYSLSTENTAPDGTAPVYSVNKGEVIVEAGERVSERAARLLEGFAGRERTGKIIYSYLGLSLLVFLILYLFYRDIKRYRSALAEDTKKMLLLTLLLVTTVIASQFFKYFFSLVADKLPLDAFTIGCSLPVSFGAMLVCLLFDFHLALGFSFVVSILLGFLFHGDPFMPVYYFLGSIVAALSVIRCKKRTAVLRAGALTGLVNVVSVLAIDLYLGELFPRGIADAGAGFFSGLLAAMIVSVTLPFFEAAFDIATDIKLLELLDPNQPLLKELVYKSPGTYHHSIVIGNLAEAAAEAIGENALLARVGAYYHDVGKIRKPEYFIENQRVSENKHDRLMPSMSSLIIVSHVKDGVELARELKLPAIVTEIIQQHHGTSLVSYFYQKARELQPLVAIAEDDYRYPGPRPRTKVAAIVMLSDAVEAASRTLDNPTPERIQALVNSVITRVFLDDQLGRCDLTLKDLRVISRSFNLILTGIFHHRIDYPGINILGEKKRGDNRDKKQPEEAKAGAGAAPVTAPEASPEHQSS